MTREEIDQLWQQAMRKSIEDNELFTRYAFAALVAAAEREACAKLVCSYKDVDWAYLSPDECAADIRARSNT